MTYPFSRPEAGAAISATVKWYDPSKGYGFLVPGDGTSDIYCWEATLAAVGLQTLLAGATVACETVQGRPALPLPAARFGRWSNGSMPTRVTAS